MEIAIQTDKAKEQHYELPTSFFKLVLGEHLKYRELMPLPPVNIVHPKMFVHKF